MKLRLFLKSIASIALSGSILLERIKVTDPSYAMDDVFEFVSGWKKSEIIEIELHPSKSYQELFVKNFFYPETLTDVEPNILFGT